MRPKHALGVEETEARKKRRAEERLHCSAKLGAERKHFAGS